MARLLDILLSDALRDEIPEATAFAEMCKAAESCERRFDKDTPFHDLADFYSSGSSGTWEGRLTADDVQDYAVRTAGVLLTPKDVAWLHWVDRRTP